LASYFQRNSYNEKIPGLIMVGICRKICKCSW